VELQTLSDKALQSFNLLIVGKPSPVVGKAARCIAIAPALLCSHHRWIITNFTCLEITEI